MLLNLPPELIQLILKHSTCGSYIQAAFSCRALLDIASSSREVILHHLHRVPGGNFGALQTSELFKLLLRRSAQQLFWAQFSATCKVFNFESQVLDARASSLDPRGSNLALVLRGQPAVYLFHAGDKKFSFTGQLRPPSPWNQEGVVEVLNTAIDENGGVYVLQRVMPTLAEEELETKHPFVMHALHSRPHGIVYLAHYKPYSSGYRVRTCAFPDHDNYEPLAFAGIEDTFAIAWYRSSEDELEVVLYTEYMESPETETGTETGTGLTYNSRTLRHECGACPNGDFALQPGEIESYTAYNQRSLTGLAFNNSGLELLYYYKAQTLYRSVQSIPNPISPHSLQSNLSRVRFAKSSLVFSIAVPFFGRRHVWEESNRVTCCRKYLTLGIGSQKYPFYGPHQQELWTVACLLKSETIRCHNPDCGHIVDLESARQLGNWSVAARLWGFQKPTSSLGSIIAASKCGTRLAIANWNVLCVWALEPDSLVENNADCFYPSFSWSTMAETIELRPTVLQLHAVCFQLRFLDGEDELLALTDKGVMYWDLSPLGRGERTTHRLDPCQDDWKMSNQR